MCPRVLQRIRLSCDNDGPSDAAAAAAALAMCSDLQDMLTVGVGQSSADAQPQRTKRRRPAKVREEVAEINPGAALPLPYREGHATKPAQTSSPSSSQAAAYVNQGDFHLYGPGERRVKLDARTGEEVYATSSKPCRDRRKQRRQAAREAEQRQQQEYQWRPHEYSILFRLFYIKPISGVLNNKLNVSSLP